MKKGLLILSVLIAFSSCDVWVVEAPYDARDNFIGRYTVDEYSETYDLVTQYRVCLLYTSPSPRDLSTSRMPSSA